MNPEKTSNSRKKHFFLFKKNDTEKENPHLPVFQGSRKHFEFSHEDYCCPTRSIQVHSRIRLRAVPPSPEQPLFTPTELANSLKTKAIATYTRVLHGAFISRKNQMIFLSSFTYAFSQHVIHICHERSAIIFKVQNNVTIENLFQSDVLSINKPTAFQCKLNTENKLAIIVGKQAVGKTTFINLIVGKILNENLYNVEYVIYIQMKWMKHERMSFLDFILSSFTDMELDINQQNYTIEMLKKSKNLIVVIDGLDDISDFPHNVVINADTQAFPEELAVSLIAGNLLPNAKKLVVLRPDQLQQLSAFLHCTYFTVLTLQGINEESKRNICEFICEETYNENILDYISKHKVISTFCFNPLNCIFIMQCLNIFMKSSLKIKQFDSVTDIYVTILELLMNSCHNMSDFKLESLSQLAWNEIVSQNDHSSRKTLKAVTSIFDCICKSGSSITIFEKLQNKIRFKHEILENFFAAIQLSFFTTANKLDTNMSLLPTNRMKSIGKFIFGFQNSEIFHRMSRLLVGISASKTLWQKWLVCEMFLNKSKLRSYVNDYSLFKLLQFCDLIYESKDISWCDYISRDLKRSRHGCPFVKFEEVIPSVDYTGLQYVLSVDGKKLVVINNPQFLGDGFFQFFDNILSFPSHVTVIAEKIFINHHLRLSQNEIQCFSGCVTRFSVIERLQISMEFLNETGLTVLIESINKRETKIEQLCFCDIASGKVLELIGMCLSNVHDLELLMIEEQPEIDFEFQAFCNQVKELQNPLRRLRFRGKLSINGITAIAQLKCIGNIEKLNLDLQ